MFFICFCLYLCYNKTKQQHKMSTKLDTMKIQTTIQFDRVSMTSKFIDDVYNIEKSDDTSKFYIWSENGYNTYGIVEYSELDKAIKHVKNVIKNYFIDRGMDNPKGF